MGKRGAGQCRENLLAKVMVDTTANHQDRMMDTPRPQVSLPAPGAGVGTISRLLAPSWDLRQSYLKPRLDC